MTASQENKNAEEITKWREYFLRRIDELQKMVGDGVTRDELSRELDRVHAEVMNYHTDLSNQVVAVKDDIKEVLTEIKAMKKELSDKQKESRNRIIGAQATALFIILSTVAALFGQFLFHR